MKALLALFSALALFFMVLNTLGGLVSGIWLAVLGEWWAIGFGLFGVFGSSFLIAVALACPRRAGPGRMRVQRPEREEGLRDEETTYTRADRGKAA